MPKAKRQNLTKEQIAKRMEEVAKAKIQRKFVKDQFFPALCKASTSISDADTFLMSFSTMIMDSLLNFMKDKPFSTLGLADKLDKKSPQYDSIKSMVQLFDEMPINEARKLIEGMKDEIRMFYRKDMQKRKLEDVPMNFYDDETK
jgi:hypothetical protein